MTDDRKPVRARPSLVPYLIPVAGGFLGTVAVALLVVFGRSAGGGAGGEPTAPPAVSAISASCTRAPSRDSVGNPTSYEPARAVDGDPTTAWRCDGDGTGQHITLELAGPARVTRIGLVPGLAKTDPGDGTDRYAQNRRIAQVRVGTDAGDVEAALETDAGHRQVQYIDVGGDHPVGHGDDPAQRSRGRSRRPGGRRLRGDLGDRRVVARPRFTRS